MSNECMKFSTDFRRLIWPLIRTAQGKIGILEGRETGRPAETSERDKTKISTPMVGVKRQLLPVLKLHVVLSPKKRPVCGWVRFVSALVLVLFWYSAWTCLGTGQQTLLVGPVELIFPLLYPYLK